MARYNLSTRLKLANCYLLSPSGVAASTAKYAHNGELFALMSLGKDVSEDTSAGRLILNNCTTVLLAPSKSEKKGELKVVQQPFNIDVQQAKKPSSLSNSGQCVVLDYLCPSPPFLSSILSEPELRFKIRAGHM